jgi:fibronectin-binding autotransporter adhesin
LTGVAYSDTGTVNDFYDPGEGLGNVTVTATPVGGGTASSTTTWASGGYSLPLGPGTYNVVLSGGGLPASVVYSKVAIASTNVELDAASDLGVWNTNGNGNWATAGNWSGILPSGSGNVATFAGAATAPCTITLSSPRTVGTINFDNASAGYTISGSSTLTLQLAGGSAQIFDYAGSHSISAPLNLASGVEVTVLAATDSLALSGPISNATAQSIVKLGKGMLNLSGNNSFSGGLTVADGTVSVGNANGLGSAAVTLGFSSDDTAILANSAVTVGNAIQVATGPGGTATLGTTLTAGTAAFSGEISLGYDLTLTAPAGGTLLLSGPIGGLGGLTKIGAGKLVLSGSDTYGGGTDVDSGILIVTNARAIAAGSSLTVGNAAAFAPVIPSALAATPVPEPGALALLVAGAVLMAIQAFPFRLRPPFPRHPGAAKDRWRE